jgi:general secretion pathway protein K
MKTFWRLSVRILKNETGVALLIALMAMTLMTFIAVEVSYDTSVDYIVAAQQVNRIKAYYAAKSGVEISLLRIMLYKQVMSTIGDSLGDNKSMLDPIWKFPFMWPPTAAGGDRMMEVDKTMMQEAVSEALMNAQYVTTISPEGGRLDINDLGSDIKSMKQAMIEQVVKIFKSEVEHNEDFRKKYSGFQFEKIVNNIADYVDEDQIGLNGGDEINEYRDLDDKNIVMPPNRPLRTLDELHQVAGMTDEFYELLAPRITVYGTKGININYASADVLKALDVSMTDQAVNKILERRGDPKLGGPFKDDGKNSDFFGFIRNLGVDVEAIEKSKVPLLYDMEFNFRIVSTGISGNVRREITAVTYDYANLKTRLAELMDKRDQDEGLVDLGNQSGQNGQNGQNGQSGQLGNNNASAQGGTGKNKKIEATKGRPSVVYWEEN